MAATSCCLVLTCGMLAGASRTVRPLYASQDLDAFNQVLRENALFFNILVTFSFTAAIAEPAWGLDVKDINLNLISRAVRDSQGHQVIRARVAGVIRKNHNVELDILNEKGDLAGRGFFGYKSGQLTFYDRNGKDVISGYMDSHGQFYLDDLRLPEGKRDLADGMVDGCYYCYSMGYAWYDGLKSQVGGGRMYPNLYGAANNKVRMYWTFDTGRLSDTAVAFGEADYTLASETTGAINSVLFDTSRTAESFFANPYSLLPKPVGKAVLPRFTNDTGIAVTNPTAKEISITYTARHNDGSLVSGDGIINPVTYRFSAGQQFAAYPDEIYRKQNDRGPILANGDEGWMEIYSYDGEVQSMYLDSNPQGTALDGNIGAGAGSSTILFPGLRTGEGESTEIALLNLAYDDVMVRLELLDKDGAVLREEREFFIAGYGMRNFYIGNGSDFLRPANLSQSASLRVSCNNSNSIKSSSCSAIVGLATNKDRYQSLCTSYAVSAGDAGQTLVGPYFAIGLSAGGAWESMVRVVKLDGSLASVYLDIYDTGGNLHGTVAKSLAPGGEAVFDLSGATLSKGENFSNGYLRLRSDSGKIAGDLTLTWSNGEWSQMSSYPLFSYLERTLQFNQVAQGIAGDIEYWTGIGLMNDLDKTVKVTVDIYRTDGNIDRSAEISLKPYQQYIALLSQLLDDAHYERVDGYVKVEASDAITGIVLYGDSKGQFLCAVPPIPR